jgi:hypothetical protein
MGDKINRLVFLWDSDLRSVNQAYGYGYSRARKSVPSHVSVRNAKRHSPTRLWNRKCHSTPPRQNNDLVLGNRNVPKHLKRSDAMIWDFPINRKSQSKPGK